MNPNPKNCFLQYAFFESELEAIDKRPSELGKANYTLMRIEGSELRKVNSQMKKRIGNMN
jgi:hypothetical protein